jgi:hypothetical protein
MASIVAIDSPPAFRITFTGTDLDENVATVTLYRTADGVILPVRTAVRLSAVGGFTAFDAEAPQGIPVTYQAMQYDASGNQLGYTGTINGLIPALEPSFAWLSDPLDETSAIQIVMTDTAGAQPKRTVPGSVYTIGSSAVALAGQQTPLTGTDMGFYTLSADDDVAVQALIKQTNGLVLIRTMPGFGVLIPRALYCFAGAANPTYLDGQGSVWDNSVSEVSPTSQPTTKSSASWTDITDTFATWDDVKTAFATWLDLEQAFDA